MVKALLVNGSPHPRGCTYTALTDLKNTLEAEGIEVELLRDALRDRLAVRAVGLAADTEEVGGKGRGRGVLKVYVQRPVWLGQ